MAAGVKTPTMYSVNVTLLIDGVPVDFTTFGTGFRQALFSGAFVVDRLWGKFIGLENRWYGTWMGAVTDGMQFGFCVVKSLKCPMESMEVIYVGEGALLKVHLAQ